MTCKVMPSQQYPTIINSGMLLYMIVSDD